MNNDRNKNTWQFNQTVMIQAKGKIFYRKVENSRDWKLLTMLSEFATAILFNENDDDETNESLYKIRKQPSWYFVYLI